MCVSLILGLYNVFFFRDGDTKCKGLTHLLTCSLYDPLAVVVDAVASINVVPGRADVTDLIHQHQAVLAAWVHGTWQV